MNKTNFMRLAARLGAICLILCAQSLNPAFAEEGGKTVRPEIGKPIQAAIDLLKQRKGKDALAKVREADAVSDKTAHENFLIEQVRGQAAAAAGEGAVAARAFELAAASPAVLEKEKLQFLAAAAGQYYLVKNYAKSAEMSAQYLKEGGADKAMRKLYVQTLYLANNFAQAAKELQIELQAAEKEGRIPAEQDLQMLADINNRQKDSVALFATMGKLVSHYPKKEYWASLVYSLSSKPGLSPQLALDILRVRLETGTMRGMEDYIDATQLALQAGFPAEAKKFIDAGYDAHLLGNGADAERHKRLRDTAARELVNDTKTLGQDDARLAAAATADPLMNTGLNYVFRGQAEKGLPMMEQALKKGGFKRLEDAKLHLGLAQALAGHKAKAVETLRTVTGKEGAAELARLWILRLGQASSQQWPATAQIG